MGGWGRACVVRASERVDVVAVAIEAHRGALCNWLTRGESNNTGRPVDPSVKTQPVAFLIVNSRSLMTRCASFAMALIRSGISALVSDVTSVTRPLSSTDT